MSILTIKIKHAWSLLKTNMTMMALLFKYYYIYLFL